MRNPLLVPDLRELIHDGEIAGLRDFFIEHHPGRVAEFMDDLEHRGCRRRLRVLPPRNRAEVLSYLENDRQAQLVKAMPAQGRRRAAAPDVARRARRPGESARRGRGRPGAARSWPRPSARTSAGWPATSPAPPARP